MTLWMVAHLQGVFSTQGSNLQSPLSPALVGGFLPLAPPEKSQHIHTTIHKADNQQGPALQHQEFYSITCNIWGKNLEKNGYMYIYNRIFAIHLKPMQCKSTILQYQFFRKKDFNSYLHKSCKNTGKSVIIQET